LPKKNEPTITNPHDQFFRTAMADKRVAREFLQAHLPQELCQLIDFDDLELQPRSFINDVRKEITVDLLYKTKDKKAVTIIKVLANLVEMLAEENALLREENQKLRDEINRLKGEQGKPNLRKQSKDGDGGNTGNSNHSSEEDRNKRKGKNKNNGW
jgi:FtsZ-binding cell division protein ZapB